MARVRIAIGLAVLATAIGFLVDMSGSAPRGAGDDQVTPAAFLNSVPGGGALCQGAMVLPNDAASIVMTVGTYGRPMPRIAVVFKDQAGRTTATGLLLAGTVQEGVVTIRLRYPHGPSVAGTLCIHVGGRRTIVIAGEGFPGGSSVRVNDRPQLARIAVLYRRPGRESWWQLLGTLDQRFGLGKSSIFGDWTLPLLALAALALWIATVRVLARELT
jgi:hypothetical protein